MMYDASNRFQITLFPWCFSLLFLIQLLMDRIQLNPMNVSILNHSIHKTLVERHLHRPTHNGSNHQCLSGWMTIFVCVCVTTSCQHVVLLELHKTSLTTKK